MVPFLVLSCSRMEFEFFDLRVSGIGFLTSDLGMLMTISSSKQSADSL